MVKGRRAEEIRWAYEAGLRHFGVNYAQEGRRLRQEAALPGDALWHFIGHLQSNKVKETLGVFATLQTVDRPSLVVELVKRARVDLVQPVFLEVNSAEESGKTGAAWGDLEALARSVAGARGLQLDGLMTMGPAQVDEMTTRLAFRRTREMAEHLRREFPSLCRLSMGMSDSWRWAVEEGATMIRVGTALFGPRPW